MTEIPSPCVDVCKYKRRGRCIACAMTKMEKSMFESTPTEARRRELLDELRARQKELGGYPTWPNMYARKCESLGVPTPEL